MSVSKCIVRVISVLRFHDMQGMLDKKLAGLFGIGATSSEKAREGLS